ncbi:MAG: hypothetical protein PWP60_1202 [Candidatus Atribacteria bacterium]|nr:hypothetical protein [Candidatus Atribacteria bacterium]
MIKAGVLPGEYQEIVDFRNLLIHRYFGEKVLNVIQSDLDDFAEVITHRIATLDSVLKQEIIRDLLEENQHLHFVIEFLKKTVNLKIFQIVSSLQVSNSALIIL